MTAALAAAFLLLAGLAAGAVAVSAAVRLCHGRWAGPLLAAAEGGAAFFLPAAVLLAILAPPLAAGAPSGAVPLAAALVAGALLALGLGHRYAALARRPGVAPGALRGAAAAALAGFLAGVSLWTAPLVLAPAPWPAFAAVPAAEAVGAFVSGVAFTAWAGEARGGAGAAARRDLANLLFGLLLLWAYLAWSIYLPTWYGDVPGEVGFLLARWSGPYRPLSALAAAAWAGAALLVFPGAGPGRARLLAAATLALAARFLQVVLLVLPAHAARGGATPGGAAAAAVVVAAFLFQVGRGRAAPRPPSRAAALAGPSTPRSESPPTTGG